MISPKANDTNNSGSRQNNIMPDYPVNLAKDGFDNHEAMLLP
jgi:hypothetical protein